MKQNFKVIIRRCENYDPDRIAGIIREGMEELNVKPHGTVLLKPNVVIAEPEIFPYAFTRSEFLDGVLSAVKEKGENIDRITVGERSGITVPTRFCFKSAGYPHVFKKHKIRASYFDEEKQVPVKLKREENLRDLIYIPKSISECDFLINLPKFKAHPWTRLTLSLKNYIGIQDDRHRLVDHNTYLEHKIADLQDVIKSSFIAVDAIEAGQRMMLTPTPFQMNAIIMGINSCAVDTVGCQMVNVDPQKLVHLKFSSDRGHGPIDIKNIEVAGDYPLEELQAKTKNFQFVLEHIDKYFDDWKNLNCTIGTFPEKHSPDYCWGGCPGALQEAMHIFKGYYPDVMDRIKKVRYVVGKVDGDLNLEEGEKVVFAGNCTCWEGKIKGKNIKIKSKYKTASEVDVRKTRSNDMLLKICSSLLKCFFKRRSGFVRAEGCPVSVAEHVNYISSLGKIGNVNFDRRTLIPVNIAYWQMRFMRFVNRFFS